ncbi:unnamed protein product [Camellia sinensis]
MWRDVSKSAFMFGVGTFIIIASSYTKDINIRGVIGGDDTNQDYIVGEEEAVCLFLWGSCHYNEVGNHAVCFGEVWQHHNYLEDRQIGVFWRRSYKEMEVGRRKRTTRNGVVAGSVWESRMKSDEVKGGIKVFNGEEENSEENSKLVSNKSLDGPSKNLDGLGDGTGGNSFELKVAKLILKFESMGFLEYSAYQRYAHRIPRSSLLAYGKFWIGQLRDTWESCSHKKVVAFGIFALIWNLSSVVARIWAGEKKLVMEIKRTAKTGNEATTKISACQLINLRQQITKFQACLQQMSPAKQTEEETEELTNQVLDEIGVDVASLLSVSPKGRIVGKTTEDANRRKGKVKTFKAPCIMDEALRVRASPLLPCTIDGASSPYVSR